MNLSPIKSKCFKQPQAGIQLELFSDPSGQRVLLNERYEVLALIGGGGFSKTYEVRDLDGTIKVLKILERKDLKHIELFQREAQVLSQLRHEGIPTVDPDAYFTHRPKNSAEPIHCFIMEKISGLNLKKYIKLRDKPINQILAVNWLIQTTNVLKFIHEHNFLHRDIKPSNIMLKSDGHLVLIDFGTARSFTDLKQKGKGAFSSTRILSSLYTPNEQIEGKAQPQSDFFALGRTFVYLLTAKNLGELYDPKTDQLHWQNEISEHAPSLVDLLEHLMADCVADRPANAENLLQHLASVQLNFKNTSTKQKAVEAEEPITKLAPHFLNLERDSKTAPVTTIDHRFQIECQQELAEFIGPIAEFICQRTFALNPSLSELELIDAIAAQIPKPDDATAFRQRFR